MRVIVTTLLCPLLAVSTIAQATWTHAKYASQQIEVYRKHFGVPGLSVAVVHNGKVVFAKGIGYANLDKKTPVRSSDYFRLASVSKPITATLVFELVEKGKLDINAPARKYLPELPAHHSYRVRELLCHQSGVRHYAADGPLKKYPTQLAALSRFVKDPLIFSPGEKTSYSTHAYTVLGAIIEKVTKKPYRIYASERLQSWGVSGVKCEWGANPNRTQIYDKVGGRSKLVKRDDLSWKHAGGGFEGTSLGLGQLGAKILAGKILRPKTLKEMWTLQVPRTGESNYSLGWDVYEDEGRNYAQHSGVQLGANSRWCLQINGGLVIVVLSNQNDHRPWHVMNFLESLYGARDKSNLPKIELD